MCGWRRSTQLCSTHQCLVLSPSAAAEKRRKHRLFWNKPSSERKSQAGLLAAHMSPPGCPGISPPVGFLTAPSLPSWKQAVYFSPSMCPSGTCLQVTEGQPALCFSLISSRLAAFSKNKPLSSQTSPLLPKMLKGAFPHNDKDV